MHLEALLIQYGYGLLFPLAVIEGPFIGVLGGFLIYSGHFSLLITAGLLLFADIITDIFYFMLGKRSDKSPRIQRYINKGTFLKTHIKTMDTLWHDRPWITMLLGKNAYTVSIAVIISAGMSRLSLTKFLSYSIPVSLLQTSVLLGVGYYLGNGYTAAQQYMKYPFIIILVLFVVFFLLYRRLGKYATNQFK